MWWWWCYNPENLTLLSHHHGSSNPIGPLINFSSLSTQTLMCPRSTALLRQPEQLARLEAEIECREPTANLYSFKGNIKIYSSEDSTDQAPKVSVLGTHNLLLRGSRLQNTESVIGKSYSMP
jgi:hypothetical protein